MKRIGGALKAALALMALAIVGGGLILFLNAVRDDPQSASGLFLFPISPLQSPPETPTAPVVLTPKVQLGMSRLAATKDAMAERIRLLTPLPEPTGYPIHTSQDIVDTVLNDPRFRSNPTHPIFGSHKEAAPGVPVRVRLISQKYQGRYYYVVPFYERDRVVGLATVWVENGRGGIGMWGGEDAPSFPHISASEAVALVKATGRQVTSEPELVTRPTIENGDGWLSPFWEIKSTDGTIYYVMYVLGTPKVFRADEIHIID